MTDIERDELIEKLSKVIEDVMATRTGPEPALEDCVEAAARCYDIIAYKFTLK